LGAGHRPGCHSGHGRIADFSPTSGIGYADVHRDANADRYFNTRPYTDLDTFTHPHIYANASADGVGAGYTSPDPVPNPHTHPTGRHANTGSG